MKEKNMTRLIGRIRGAGLAVLALGLVSHAQQPLGTSFTYQGQLKQSGSPINAAADFQFSLFDAASAGNLVAGPVSQNNVAVANGLFTVTIDFGAAAFNGQARFLQVAARTPAGSGAFTTLGQRQMLTAAPYALKVPGVDGNSLDAADGSPVDAVAVDNSGNVGVGTTAPAAKLHISDGDLVAGAPGEEWIFHTRSSFGGDFLQITDRDAGNPNFKFAQGLTLDESGRVGIGTTAPNGGLHVKREPITNGGTLTLEGTTHTYIAFFPDGAGAGRKGFLGFASASSSDISLFNEISGGNISLITSGGGVTKVNVLQITGADLAEKFATSERIEPGMVVAIDPRSPGRLCLARGAYNRCVAGVVSGANNFSAGAVLGNLPGSEDAPPVALSGRVYVRCDAALGAIQPGDLLTTSDTPGHAMKAVDLARAQGAVLGKAMTSLESGDGMVLVLMSLQ